MNDDLVSQLLREKRAREQADPDARSPYEPLRVPERSAPRSATVPPYPVPASGPAAAPPPLAAPGALSGPPPLPSMASPQAPAPSASTAPPREQPMREQPTREPMREAAREQPPHRAYDAPRTAGGQPTAAEEALKTLIEVGGAGPNTLAAAAPILMRLLKTVDWVKVLQSVEEGVGAKQERAIYRAVAITWEEFGVCSEFVMQLLRDADKLDRDVLDKVVELFKGEKPAWYFSPERKNDVCRELLPRLAQIQAVLGRARRHADDGGNGEAQKDLEQLATLLKSVRTYFNSLNGG
jgi:hypothetical protein